MHLDHFGSVTSIEEITCMGWGLNLSIVRQLPTAAWRQILCCWSNCLRLNDHSEEFRMRYLHWQERINVNSEQVSFLRLLGSNWTLFWRMFMTNRSCKREKQSRQLSLWRQDGAQPDEDQKLATAATISESQFRQCRNSALPHPLLSPWYTHSLPAK